MNGAGIAQFKPGIYETVRAFLSDVQSLRLCSFGEQARAFGVYPRIAGYTD